MQTAVSNEANRSPLGYERYSPEQRVRLVIAVTGALRAYPERVARIVGAFPEARVVRVADQESTTIREKIFAEYPEARGDMPQAISLAKRVLVVGTGGGVKPFQNAKDLICPTFHAVTPMSNGCVYSCQYCFLQGTYRGMFPFMKVNVNWEELVAAMRRTALKDLRAGRPTNFNLGEMLDSLAFEPVTGFMEHLFDAVEAEQATGNRAFARSTFVLLSKSAEVGWLLRNANRWPNAQRLARASWSVNTPFASRTYEIGAASTEGRLTAAHQVQQAGYRVRLRIDPMIPYEGWPADYEDLARRIYQEHGLRPEVVTLGSLRYEKQVPHIGRDRFPGTDLFDHPLVRSGNDKDRLPPELRTALYTTMIGAIREHDREQKIGLCKETTALWEAVPLSNGSNDPQCCNCVTGWSIGEATRKKTKRDARSKKPKGH